ncbi:T9SS type A sorting domain-containing protein [candidate division KSB1 bacterium]|nr:T9SS type A sorting domain-containing protein [candidate division KSB1 bacterium]
MGILKLHRQAMIICFLIFLFLVSGVHSSGIRLTWNSNSEPDLAGYRIYYGSSSGQYSHKLIVTEEPTVVVPNLFDNVEYFIAVTAFDTADNESPFSTELNFVLGDTTAPTIVSLIPLDDSHLLLNFNETLRETSVQEIRNYSINNGLQVISAVFGADYRSVVLTTNAPFGEGEHSIAIQNIADIALPPNFITPTTKDFEYPPQQQDTTPPLILSAQLVSNIELEVMFSKAVDPVSAQNPNNYRIDNEVELTSVKLRQDNTVRLVTTPHIAHVNYTITINNILDQTPRKNKIPDNSTYFYHFSPGDDIGPVVTLVNMIDIDLVEILFNEPVDRTSAENITHYNINGDIRVLSAELDNTGQIVRLHTTQHAANYLYFLIISQITDDSPAKNPIQYHSGYAYVFEPDDRTPPVIQRVDVLDDTHLRVVFCESLDRETAQNTLNYQLSGDVSIVAAVLDASGSGVYLQTSPHTAGQVYVLRVNNVKDDSKVGNPVLPNSSYTFVFPGENSSAGPVIVEVRPERSSLYLYFDKPLFPETATDILNYRTSPELFLYTASLSADQKTVMLETAPHTTNQLYNLTVTNLSDTQGNRLTTGGSFVYIYKGEDIIRPFVTLVQIVDRENIDVLFSENLDRISAENIKNYSITGGVQVLDARLGGSGRVVHLHTTIHDLNQLFVLHLNNIRDSGTGANEILSNSSYSYLFSSPDNLDPTIAFVRPVNSQYIEVSFSEPVDMPSALDARHYTLNQEIQVISVKKGRADHIVELSTTPLPSDKLLLLSVHNVLDRSGNDIPPNSSYTFTFEDLMRSVSPTLVDVKNLNVRELLLVFETPVSKEWALHISSYLIYGGVAITDVQIDESGTVVKLTTSPHQRDQLYVLMFNGVQDNKPYFYFYSPINTAQPVVKTITVATDILLKIVFSTSLERSSAENINNYSINRDVAVLAAKLDAAGNILYLETSRHRAGVAYSLSIADVKGVQDGVVNTCAAYTYLPSLQLEIDGKAETCLSYLDMGKSYYLDRNYVVTHVPEFMQHARMIMTLNGEKGRTDTDYLTLQLSQAAFVYVGFDSRAEAVPRWLSSSFAKTNESIGVTDACENLELWRCYCPAGEVNLGANNAAGAKGAESMYIVVILEPSEDIPDYGKFDAAYNSQGRFPEQFKLYQNYPNPFNPRTTIRFDLPESRLCKVTIYDVLGRQVTVLYDAYTPAGEKYLEWNGENDLGVTVSSGIYFYRLEVWRDGQYNGLPYRENFETVVKKMTLLR